jgi:hypothetical protein
MARAELAPFLPDLKDGVSRRYRMKLRGLLKVAQLQTSGNRIIFA